MKCESHSIYIVCSLWDSRSIQPHSLHTQSLSSWYERLLVWVELCRSPDTPIECGGWRIWNRISYMVLCTSYIHAYMRLKNTYSICIDTYSLQDILQIPQPGNRPKYQIGMIIIVRIVCTGYLSCHRGYFLVWLATFMHGNSGAVSAIFTYLCKFCRRPSGKASLEPTGKFKPGSSDTTA